MFGNIDDPNSRVSKLKKQDRDYTVLEFLLHASRALTYLARVRNPNPAMPDYYETPLSPRNSSTRRRSLQEHGRRTKAHRIRTRSAKLMNASRSSERSNANGPPSHTS